MNGVAIWDRPHFNFHCRLWSIAVRLPDTTGATELEELWAFETENVVPQLVGRENLQELESVHVQICRNEKLKFEHLLKWKIRRKQRPWNSNDPPVIPGIAIKLELVQFFGVSVPGIGLTPVIPSTPGGDADCRTENKITGRTSHNGTFGPLFHFLCHILRPQPVL